MFGTRIHGRGGQGVVTAAELLSVAGFTEGHHAQAMPSFGSERTGAPVTASCRFDSRPIRTREPVLEPEALIVQDPTLRFLDGTLDGLVESGFLLVNSVRPIGELGIERCLERLLPGRAIAIPAARIAREHLGRPLPGAALLGGFAALTGEVSLDSVLVAIDMRFDDLLARQNMDAATDAYGYAADAVREASHA